MTISYQAQKRSMQLTQFFDPDSIEKPRIQVIKEDKKKAQRENILKALKQGPQNCKQLSNLATQYNARIYELRRSGFPIEYNTISRSFILKTN